MKLCFTSLGCPAWSLEQVVENAAKMGFDGVELRGIAGEHIGPRESADERQRIKRIFADAGVAIAAIMGYSRFTDASSKAREEHLAIAECFIEVAADVGCPTLRVFGGEFGDANREQAIAMVIDGLRRLTPLAEKAGVRLALETHDDWCKGENLRAVIDGVGSDALGACWDVANAFFVEPLDQTFAAIGDRIVHVHFKDAVRGPDGKNKSVLPGTGQVDMQRALELLHAGGYDGWLSFEWEKKWEPDLDEPETSFPHYLRHARSLMRKVGV